MLTIHVDHHSISDPEAMRQVCESFADGTIQQHPRHNNLRDFYKGRGAMVIDYFTCSERSGSENTAAGGNGDDDAVGPPPYPAARELSPVLLFAQRIPKRKQHHFANADTSLSNKKQHRYADSGTSHLGIVGICTEFLTRQQTQMGEFISQQQAQMGRMLACISD